MLSFLGIYTLAIVSPGPNFFLVTSAALTRSRNEGLLISFGVATGSAIFAFAGLASLLPLVHSLPFFAEWIRFAGGGYLLLIAVSMLKSCSADDPVSADSECQAGSAIASYRVGLVTNLTNPKAWAFYLSLFALVLDRSFPFWNKLILNIAMFMISLAWYSSMSILISSRTFQPVFLSLRPVIQGGLGVVLLVAAISILWG